MPRPKLMRGFYTTGQVAKLLGLAPNTVIYRIKQKFYDPPEVVDNGVRYFSEEWLKKAKG